MRESLQRNPSMLATFGSTSSRPSHRSGQHMDTTEHSEN